MGGFAARHDPQVLDRGVGQSDKRRSCHTKGGGAAGSLFQRGMSLEPGAQFQRGVSLAAVWGLGMAGQARCRYRQPPMNAGRRRRVRFAVGLAAALVARTAIAGAGAEETGLSLLAPSDRGLRSDLAWLVDRGVLQLPLGTWPLPSSALRAAWAGVDPSRLDAADADALARVQRAVLRSTDTARLTLRANSARHPSLDGGSTTKGIASGALSFYAGNANLGGQLTLSAVGDSLTPDAPQGSLDGSYVVARLGNTAVAAGAVDRWWGPGFLTSPILSTAATPIAGVIVRRAEDSVPQSEWLRWIGRWGYEISAGRLAHYDPRGTRTIGLRFYTKPWPNVEIGVSRSILWAGAGRPHDWVAFRDALRGRSNVDDPSQKYEDPSDEIAGSDLRIAATDAWGGTWVGSLHLVGEDEAGSLPTKLFGSFGLQRKAAVGGQRLDWTFEATDTMPSHLFGLRSANPPPAYQHSVYQQGYYQGQLPIGAAIGGGGELYSVGLAWTRIDDPMQLRVEGRLFWGRMSWMGDQTINAAYGVTGKLTGLMLGVEGETATGLKWQLGLSVQDYPEGGRPVAGLLAGVEIPITGR